MRNNMSSFSEQENLIQSRIADWLERNNENLSNEERRDIAFHMTDWFSDYEELKAFFAEIDEIDYIKMDRQIRLVDVTYAPIPDKPIQFFSEHHQGQRESLEQAPHLEAA